MVHVLQNSLVKLLERTKFGDYHEYGPSGRITKNNEMLVRPGRDARAVAGGVIVAA